MPTPGLLDTAAASRYAEAGEARPGLIDALTGRAVHWLRRDGENLRGFARKVEAAAAGLRAQGKLPEAADVARVLRTRGLRDDALERCFALVSEARREALGAPLAAGEVMAARAMLAGRLAAVQDPGARERAALAAAIAAALAGLRVHVLLPHGELARRRAEAAAPLLAALGLEAGVIAGEERLAERRAAYARPIVFADAREAATDHLRDRLVLRGRAGALALEVEALAGRGRIGRLLHGGLHCAIVEDAERVLVEDASAPLAVFGAEQAPGLTEACRQALDLAAGLAAGRHYVLDEPWPTLTEDGCEHLAVAAVGLGGLWAGPARRELLVCAALAATQAFERGRDYEAEGGRIVAGGELEDRVPEEAAPALVRMLELKEGCGPGETRRLLARIAPERVYRRYLLLGGAFEPQPGAARTLAAHCGRRIERIDAAQVPAPAAAPIAATVVAGEAALVETVAERAAARRAAGEAVRVVAADAAIATLVREALAGYAGDAGCTVTDERSLPVADRSRAHVVVAGVLPSRWAQGRAAASATAVELVVAEDDPFLASFATAGEREALDSRSAGPIVERVQRRAERAAERARRDLAKLEDHLGEALAYAGRRM